jgi:hypothetical protein
MGAGMSAVRRAISSPFYRVGGGAGRPGVGGEQAAAVVRHNGMKAPISEGNRPGWWWGVIRRRCSGRYGSGGSTGGGVRQRGREGKARWASRRPLGWLPGGPPRGSGEVGRGWVKNQKWAKVQKEILFEFQLILEIW